MPIINLKVLTNNGGGTYLDLDVSAFYGEFPIVTPDGLNNLFQDALNSVGEGAVYEELTSTLTLPINILGFAKTANKTTADYSVGDTITLDFGSQTIYAVPATSRLSVDLTTLSGWASLSAGEKSITIVAKASGFKDSAPSAAVQVTKAATMPAKGDIITLDSKQYRVLKTEGTVAEVLEMYNSTTSQKFDTSGTSNVYANSDLDVYLSQTFYNSLSSAMQNAIVEKTFQQDSWYFSWTPGNTSGNPKYIGYASDNDDYEVSLGSATFGSSISRKCYVLSVQDVIDYLGVTPTMTTADTTLTPTNVWKMFWNQTTSPGSTSPGSTYPWLRSASVTDSTLAFGVRDDYGVLSGSLGIDADEPVRPAFQIDLSKISWS